MSKPGVYGYWEHLDYIIDRAADNGIYIAMDCIWGSMIGQMDVKKAAAYGKFLGERYKDKPNIIWMIGGDILGDKSPEVWDALARAIKKYDNRHIMTFHPRGRTTSARWFTTASGWTSTCFRAVTAATDSATATVTTP